MFFFVSFFHIIRLFTKLIIIENESSTIESMCLKSQIWVDVFDHGWSFIELDCYGYTNILNLNLYAPENLHYILKNW